MPEKALCFEDLRTRRPHRVRLHPKPFRPSWTKSGKQARNPILNRPLLCRQLPKKWVVIGGIHRLRLEFTGTDFAREVSVSHRKGSEPFTLAGAGEGVRYTQRGWSEWMNRETERAAEILDQARRPLIAAWEQAWRE